MSVVALQNLGEVAQFIRGITFKPDDVIAPSEAGAIACMRTKNVQTDLDLSDVWAVPLSFVKRPEQFLREGDILVSTANSWNLVGKCCWVPALQQKSTLGGFISALRSTSDKLDSRYLYHWFSFDPVQALVRNCARKTTNIANLSFDQCLALQVPLPPLEEQKRIAAILDHADELRRKRMRAIDRLNQLGQAIFHEMFGDLAYDSKRWPRRSCSDVLTDVTNGLTRRHKGSDVGNDIVLRLKDVRDGWIDFSDPSKISLTDREKSKYFLVDGDLLFIRVNGNPDYVGRCAVFEGYSTQVFFNDHIMRVRVDSSKILPRFLAFLLSEPNGKREISKHRKTSAGQHTINQDGLGKVGIVLPPLETQSDFIRKLGKIDQQINRLSRQARLASQLIASLQHRAFRGEL